MEVTAYRSDGSEVRIPVSPLVAETVGYIALREPHPLDVDVQRPVVQVRPYQVEALEATHGQRGGGRSLLDVSMGLGKTTVGVLDALSFLNYKVARGEGDNLQFAWFAHTDELVNQAARRCLALYPNASVGLLTGRRKTKDWQKVQFLFGTLQATSRQLHRLDPDKYRHMVVDESHHGPADTFSETIRHFNPEYLLGLTGTAYRSDSRNLTDIFGPTAYQMSLPRGVVEGWLTPVDYRLRSDKVIQNAIDRGFHSPRALRRAMAESPRLAAIAADVTKMQATVKDPTTLVFCDTIQQADAVAEALPDSKALHSDLTTQEQTNRLQDFRDGELGTLVTVGMATEGLDVPKVNVLAFLGAATWMGRFVQRLARGMRPSEGKDKVLALDYVGNSEQLFFFHRLLLDIKEEYKRYHASRYRDPGDLEEAADSYIKEMSFTFTDQEVDIIKRLSELHNAPPPGVGWSNEARLAQQLDLPPERVRLIIKDLRIEGEWRRPEGRMASLYYSPIQVSYVALAVRCNRWLEENAFSLTTLMERSGVASTTLRTRLKGLGIKTRPLTIGSSQHFVCSEDGERYFAEFESEEVFLTIGGIERVTGATVRRVRNAIKSLGVEGAKNGNITTYSSDQVTAIQAYLKAEDMERPPALSGYRTRAALRSQYPGLDRIIAGDTTERLKPKQMVSVRGSFTDHFSPRQISMIATLHSQLARQEPGPKPKAT